MAMVDLADLSGCRLQPRSPLVSEEGHILMCGDGQERPARSANAGQGRNVPD